MRNGLSWGKKQKNCDLQNPEDKTKGDQWDHTGIDVPSRFVVSMVIGKRSKDNVKKVVADFADRTGNVPPELITTDDCSSYADAFLEQYGETIIPEKTGARGRPRKPFKRMPKGAVFNRVELSASYEYYHNYKYGQRAKQEMASENQPGLLKKVWPFARNHEAETNILSLTETAEYLGVSEDAARRWCEEGRLQAIKRRWRWSVP